MVGKGCKIEDLFELLLQVFITIWFWYVMLATLLGGLLLYRIALFTLPGLRPRAMHKHNKSVPIETVEAITNKTSIGDW